MADEMINSYVALDLETTGIGARHEKIMEIGMVKVIDGETTDTYHTMVNPHREIPKRIVELTGITDDMVKDALGIEEILDEVLAFTEDLPLLGHQIIFDYGFLVQAAVNQKRKFEKYGLRNTFRPQRDSRYCPQRDARSLPRSGSLPVHEQHGNRSDSF